MPFIEQAGLAALNAGMGMMLGQYNDARQIRQQQDLQNLQIRGNKQMMDYGYKQQMQMWRDTNYAAQVAQMKAAGLSPGLIYGMKGGGGITTGSPAGGIQGANAPMGGGEIPTMIGQGMQLELLKAQKENIQADTANKQAQTTKTSGVDTQKAQTEIMDLTQGIQNKQAEVALKQVQTDIQHIQKRILAATEQEAIDLAVAELGAAQQKVMQLEIKTFIDRATQNDIVDTIKAELAGTVLRNILTKAQTTTERGKPGVQAAEIDHLQQSAMDIIRRGVQHWRELEMTGKKIGLEEQHELREEMKTIGIPENLVDDIINGLILKNIMQPKPQPPKRDWRFYKKTDVIK